MNFGGRAAVAACGVVLGSFGVAATGWANDSLINTEYFYLEIEGGYAFSDGLESTRAPLRPVEPDGGFYGTVTLGHEDPETGIVWGYVDRAEIWVSYFDHGDDQQSGNVGSAAVPIAGSYFAEREYWEIGTRFQHYFEEPAADKYSQPSTSNILLGIEPFYGRFDEESVEVTGAVVTPAELDTDIFGAMLSLEGEWDIAPSTTFLGRAAVGGYFGDADYTSPAFNLSDDFGGFRGQLAIGLQQHLSESISLAVMGRLDYFSAVGDIDGPAAAPILGNDDLLVLTIGANINFKFNAN
ncbi:MAG: hypothetical protein AAGD23_11835 [Pseudomonadota bacterium]